MEKVTIQSKAQAKDEFPPDDYVLANLREPAGEVIEQSLGPYQGTYYRQLEAEYALMGLDTDLLALYLDIHFTADAIVSIRDALEEDDPNTSAFELTMRRLINLELPVREAFFIVVLTFFLSEVRRGQRRR